MTQLNHSAPRKRIAIFGSANLTGSSEYQDSIEVLGDELAQQDVDIYVGSTTGLIGRFLRGAHREHKNSHIRLVAYGDQRYMNTDDVDELLLKGCYFSRLSVLTSCDLFIVLDGQLGTMAEIMVTWNQLQAKMDFTKKIIIFGQSESHKIHFLLDEFTFSKQAYRDLVYFADSVDDILSAIDAIWSVQSNHC